MKPKVFYGIRKTTRVATIAEAHEAFEGARNVVNVVLLSPNAGDSGNQESDTEEILAENMEVESFLNFVTVDKKFFKFRFSW